MLYTIILVVIILICILLTIVILLQPGQGQGLGGGMAGGALAGGAGLGARRTADLLSKSTTILGTALLVLSVLANFAITNNETVESAIQQSEAQVPAQNDFNLPSESSSEVPTIPPSSDTTGN